jgi:hypothetical protein
VTDLTSEEEKVQQVWEKGKMISGYDKDKYRKDACDAWMRRDKYGDRQSRLGWEMDHIDSSGTDDLSNLRPLQWENNLDKSDKKRLTCVVTSEGDKNVNK